MRRAPSTAAKTNRNTHRPREAEMNLQALRGVIPAIVTPFDTDGGVDLPATATLTRWLVDSGVHAIMTTGGTGEVPPPDRAQRGGAGHGGRAGGRGGRARGGRDPAGRHTPGEPALWGR